MNDKFYINEPVEIESRAEGDTKQDYITGYAVRFDKWSVPLAVWNEKGFVESIDKRALEGVDMSKVIASVNHNFDKVLARAEKGTLGLKIDDNGLKYEIKVPNTTVGRDTLEDVRNGNLTGSSFIFTTVEDKWVFKKEGHDERTVLKIGKLIELGPVTMPAYPDSSASAAKRSYDEAIAKETPEKTTDFKSLERKLRIHKLNLK